MDPQERRQLLSDCRTVVVKVGSRVLSQHDGHLDLDQVEHLATQLCTLADGGKQVVLVSSGAVASGIAKLGLGERPRDLARLQAVASVGQAHLIQAYEGHFSKRGRHVAQLLLVAGDLDDRERYLNVRNTLTSLIDLGVIPIVNENDVVAVDELLTTFGDNDRLAAMVTGLFTKPALIILSDVDGLYDADPDLDASNVIPRVAQIDEQTLNLAGHSKSGVGKGGMASKVRAAQVVVQSGAAAIIAGGRVPNVLTRLMAGEELGTIFLPQARGLTPRKRWIGFSAQAAGSVVVDEGAANVLHSRGPSLLAIGIVDVSGEFHKGDVISIRSIDGAEIAKGLSNYSAAELRLIKGLRSPKIADVLGHCPYEEVVHRDNMTVVAPGPHS